MVITHKVDDLRAGFCAEMDIISTTKMENSPQNGAFAPNFYILVIYIVFVKKNNTFMTKTTKSRLNNTIIIHFTSFYT